MRKFNFFIIFLVTPAVSGTVENIWSDVFRMNVYRLFCKMWMHKLWNLL